MYFLAARRSHAETLPSVYFLAFFVMISRSFFEIQKLYGCFGSFISDIDYLYMSVFSRKKRVDFYTPMAYIVCMNKKFIYTGDMANHSGKGEIVGIQEATKYSPTYYLLKFEDGRSGFKKVPKCCFEKHPGQRFFIVD